MATSILFMGKKSWSAVGLREAVAAGLDVRGVVAREPEHERDRRRGTLWEEAARLGLPRLSEEEAYAAAAGGGLEVDYLVSYLFWAIVREPLLGVARLGAINLHPAPLPDLRGLAGYNVAIMEEHTEYGVSAHFMEKAVDAGDLIAVRRFAIEPAAETALSLEQRSMAVMLELWRELLPMLGSGRPLPRVPQGHGRYVDREEFERLRRANLDDPAELMERRARAFFFPPQHGAHLQVGGEEFTLVSGSILRDLAERLLDRQA